jgi:hypothetical protein
MASVPEHLVQPVCRCPFAFQHCPADGQFPGRIEQRGSATTTPHTARIKFLPCMAANTRQLTARWPRCAEVENNLGYCAESTRSKVYRARAGKKSPQERHSSAVLGRTTTDSLPSASSRSLSATRAGGRKGKEATLVRTHANPSNGGSTRGQEPAAGLFGPPDHMVHIDSRDAPQSMAHPSSRRRYARGCGRS